MSAPNAKRPIEIPLSRVVVDDDVKKAVLAAIDSHQYILGPQCLDFERALADHIGVRHAVLTSSGTAALWMIFRVLGLKAGDEVLVPAHTAFPTIEAICAAGGTPVFVDVDQGYGLDPQDASRKVTIRTVAIVPVHLYGEPVDLSAIRDLVAGRGVPMIEDCCQAIGASWGGRKVGSFGRAGALSFYPSKNLTVLGDGGAVVTDDDELAARCRRLRDHGRVNKDVHVEIGFNLRFNEIQAAAGRALLGRLDVMNDRRRELAARYRQGLAGLPLVLPSERPSARHVYHLYVIRTPRRAALAQFLQRRGIQTGIHYPVPSHRQPAVAHLAASSLPRTERLVEEILTLPISAGHTDAEIDAVTAAVREFFEGGSAG